MKSFNGFQMMLLFCASILIFSCTDTDQELKNSSVVVDQEISGEELAAIKFTPSVNFTIEEGMFVFASEEDLGTYLDEVNQSHPTAVNEWEASIGMTTHRNIFTTVVEEETRISDEMESLSKAEQERYLAAGEIHSAAYDQALASGVIKIITDEEDQSTYFGYGVAQPSLSGALNKEGLVKVDSKIYQYTDKSMKIILSGDFAKIPELARKTQDEFNDEFVVSSMTLDQAVAEGEMTPEANTRATIRFFSKTNNWRSDGSKRRCKAYLSGASVLMFNAGGGCFLGLRNIFELRTEAQKKNFWGNWKYNSGYGPALNVVSANWSYSYRRTNSCGSPSGTITSGLGGSGKVPVWSQFYSWTNNGFFPLRPHTGTGYFQAPGSTRYTCALNTAYNIPVYYGPGNPAWWDITRP